MHLDGPKKVGHPLQAARCSETVVAILRAKIFAKIVVQVYAVDAHPANSEYGREGQKKINVSSSAMLPTRELSQQVSIRVLSNRLHALLSKPSFQVSKCSIACAELAGRQEQVWLGGREPGL